MPLDLKKLSIHSLLLLSISFFILIFYVPVGGAIDMYFIHPWMDQFGNFIYRNNWYLVHINHRIFKYILIAVYVSFLVLWCASFKVKRLKANRWLYGYMFWVSILSTGLIGLLKSKSAHACPWNMTHETATGFIWDFTATHGHCFPGGHASTGFALVTGFFVYRLARPKLAYVFLFAGLICGFILGWGQMMRGAHFLSHNLWTGWIILAMNCVLYFFFYRKFQRQIQAKNSHSVDSFNEKA
ncbi:phosphatase PAP2 family protein [Acinetobacter sp. ANC 3832]|uniref:phosphatase PAP2 family protein n=1 Tax=Acinetobacter sp. ANC 3832 TaxID=1977874 RepID=UPI000A34B86A|nr:phosphatase PAP2 family protein [Acinetobacter sp. ANC 3832]OTG93016.1 hypothetical protein B9T35_10745 [Acinetobacter sp. ANC 3832]